MIQRGIIIPDQHFPLIDRPALNCVLRAIEIIKPTFCVNLGDVGEWESVSHWQWKKKRRPPLEYQIPFIEQDIKAVNAGLDEIDAALKKAGVKEKHICVGNHDEWLDRFCEENPYLADKYSFVAACRLKKRGYTVHPIGKYYKRGHLYFYHGHHYGGVSHTRTHLLATGANIMYAHWHDNQYHSVKHVDGRKAAWAVGCIKDLSDEANEWNQRRKHNWGHALTYVDFFKNGNFSVHTTEIVEGRCTLWDKVIDGNKAQSQKNKRR